MVQVQVDSLGGDNLRDANMFIRQHAEAVKLMKSFNASHWRWLLSVSAKNFAPLHAMRMWCIQYEHDLCSSRKPCT